MSVRRGMWRLQQGWIRVTDVAFRWLLTRFVRSAAGGAQRPNKDSGLGNTPIHPPQLDDLAWDFGGQGRGALVFAYRCTNADYATWVFAATVAV